MGRYSREIERSVESKHLGIENENNLESIDWKVQLDMSKNATIP